MGGGDDGTRYLPSLSAKLHWPMLTQRRSLSLAKAITVLCLKYSSGCVIISDVILRSFLESYIFNFLGWGETESTWYVGH
jgi:hypothetical protein